MEPKRSPPWLHTALLFFPAALSLWRTPCSLGNFRDRTAIQSPSPHNRVVSVRTDNDFLFNLS